MAGNEEFNPNGLRILVVDDSEFQLEILKHMLVLGCCYNVTTTNRAEEALAMLREHPDNFDLVLSDVEMPDMDGFKLLEMIGLTMDLPVIMMSAHAETSVVMKGITHGACDYLIKPVRMEELKNIWQHVIRKRVKEHLKDETVDSDKTARTLGEQDQFPKKRKEKFTAQDEPTEDISSLKKARVLWSKELHEQFVQAVNQIGIDKAVPTKILEVMKIEGLTRENVASHLQKYRMYLKRLSGIPLQPHPVASFKASGSGGFGGVMHIQPGGKISTSSSGSKGVNLGSGPNSNLGRGGRVGAHIDQSTLFSLSQLQERQRVADPMTTATNAGQVSVGSNVRAADSWQFHPLQRLSSAELDNLMLAAHEQQQSVAQQQLNCIPVIKDDLGSLPGLGTMRIGEETSVLAGLGNLGSGEMGTLVDFRASKMEHVELAAVGELGLDKFRDFESPSHFSTVSSMSGGLGSESSFGTYTEFAAGRGFLASSPPEFGQSVVDLFQSKVDRSRAGGGVPYGAHTLHGQEEFAPHN